MVSIGVLGYGVVGSGVVELIQRNIGNLPSKIGDDLSVQKILVRNMGKYKENQNLLTDKFEELLNEDIQIIVEAMGGLNPAYHYVKKALEMKKHVVTANKDLIAAYGDELSGIAENNGVTLAYEASVGGGIPILRPIGESLAANEISQIVAILNGTTNFILTKMYEENRSYEDALKEAQALGFAEANPESDVMGYDAARKLAILSAIAYNRKIDWQEIPTEGICQLDKEDMDYARKQGCTIKLLAMSHMTDKGLYGAVRPVIVPSGGSLGKIENEFNGIFIKGDAVGEMMFTGKGAGKLPTASAVLGDIVHIIQNNKKEKKACTREKISVTGLWDMPGNWFLRIQTSERYKMMAVLGQLFQTCNIFAEEEKERGEVAVVVEVKNEEELNEKIEYLQSKLGIMNVKKIMKLGEKA